MGKKCLYCYQEVMGEKVSSTFAVRNSFGTTNPPILDYTLQEMEMLAKQVIETSVAVPGSSAKIIYGLTKDVQDANRG